ncbi:hypothetical protein GGX14DRAFT_460205 [Mycena pura]|uniref:Galactose-binding like protein n=1 Tax=Mycena pura TaxID=153505 RepID=A0AAD6V7G7_9AGAR|nr:hypothetical protein GGX14DRAFT_460205 [Mycena pura]
MSLLLTPDTPIKVSSTLDKSVGKKHLVDNNPETCWTSQQGLPQYVQIAFPDCRVVPESVHLTFQGGFVGTRCAVKVPRLAASAGDGDNWQLVTRIFPEDVNRRQEFSLLNSSTESGAGATLDDGIDKVRLEFEESSDFFGRITLYDLKLYGRTV